MIARIAEAAALVLFLTGGVYAQKEMQLVPDSPEDVCPLKPGQRVPTVQLTEVSGESVSLDSILSGRKTVLIFYRGGWCPYCNLHLAGLQKIEHDLQDLGFQIVAVSADRPEKLQESIKTQSLTYRLLSDSSMSAAQAVGIAFRLDGATVDRYRNHHMDLEEASGRNHHLLPVPAVFLIDEGSSVRFSHVNPNYRVRLEPSLLLAAARTIVSEDRK